MTTTSIVDDILTSLSNLSHQPPRLPFSTTDLSSRYTTDKSPLPTANALKNLPASASEDAKSLFLTLHFLFPHELLPALDLLDRCLVTRLITPNNGTDVDTTSSPVNEVFYIRSASALPTHSTTNTEPTEGRFRNALSGKGSATQTFYEVRLDSWNCSCAAFAFSAFGLMMRDDEDKEEQGDDEGFDEGKGDAEGARRKEENEHNKMKDWIFGGIITRSDVANGVPVCKHILAAVMSKAAPRLFAEDVHVRIRRDVAESEIAGWVAGWGEGG